MKKSFNYWNFFTEIKINKFNFPTSVFKQKYFQTKSARFQHLKGFNVWMNNANKRLKGAYTKSDIVLSKQK